MTEQEPGKFIESVEEGDDNRVICDIHLEDAEDEPAEDA